MIPLPNLVMFPNVIQPLHIFEPRYINLVEASLSDDRLMAMALLRSGWEAEYEGRPPVHPAVCLVRIISHVRLEKGRFNLLVQGVRRATVVREQPPTKSFRIADVAVLEDLYPAQGAIRRTLLRTKLLACFESLLPATPGGHEPFEQEHGRSLSLGALADIVTFSLELGLQEKLKLLAEWNVDVRTGILLQRLQDLVDGSPQRGTVFPPGFSEN